jgi:hypothetical protein
MSHIQNYGCYHPYEIVAHMQKSDWYIPHDTEILILSLFYLAHRRRYHAPIHPRLVILKEVVGSGDVSSLGNEVWFIYLLFIQLGAVGYGWYRKEIRQQQEQQNRCTEANKCASLTKEIPHRAAAWPIHPRAVVLGEVVGRCDVPSQGHLHWSSILCVPSWSWPCAWVLPLGFTLILPLRRLSLKWGSHFF